MRRVRRPAPLADRRSLAAAFAQLPRPTHEREQPAETISIKSQRKNDVVTPMLELDRSERAFCVD
jgi:hypothetical protein